MVCQEIKDFLAAHVDARYAAFVTSLMPGARPVVGVRLPVLRALAKEIAKGDWRTYLEEAVDDTFEEVMLQGYVTGAARMPFEEQMDRIFRTSGLMRDKWDRKQAGSTYGAISIRNTVNTCAAVYMPVNAQDIVDEEFSKLDEDRVFICIADVSGKDISAAMFMVETKTLIEANCALPPDQMLTRGNDILS